MRTFLRCEDLTMTEEPFAFDIKNVFVLEAGPAAGLYLAGTITAGVVRVGDSLEVLDPDRAIGRVVVDAVEFMDGGLSGSSPWSLVALGVSGMGASEVAAGHRLRSVEHHAD
jgi:hypothetical protein